MWNRSGIIKAAYYYIRVYESGGNRYQYHYQNYYRNLDKICNPNYYQMLVICKFLESLCANVVCMITQYCCCCCTTAVVLLLYCWCCWQWYTVRKYCDTVGGYCFDTAYKLVSHRTVQGSTQILTFPSPPASVILGEEGKVNIARLLIYPV